MVNPIPKFAKNVWSKWNIRGVVLVSLSLQIILIILSPFRKRSRTSILVFLLWSTYLLADFTASFCVGLISNKYGDEDTPISSVNDFLLAFWAPFLLLHLGGPDPITAFALEDNELWLRHMLGLIVQVCLTGYVFLLTLPDNTLWIPTSLVFMAGIIKFAERTRSLQLASVSNFRQSMVRKPDPGPNYAKLMEELKSRREAGLPTRVVKMPEISDQLEDIPDQEPNSSVSNEATKQEIDEQRSSSTVNATKPDQEPTTIASEETQQETVGEQHVDATKPDQEPTTIASEETQQETVGEQHVDATKPDQEPTTIASEETQQETVGEQHSSSGVNARTPEQEPTTIADEETKQEIVGEQHSSSSVNATKPEKEPTTIADEETKQEIVGEQNSSSGVNATKPEQEPTTIANEETKHEIVGEQPSRSSVNETEPEKKPTTKANNDVTQLKDVAVVKEAYRYFTLFKGLVVDMIFSFRERSESRNFFVELTAVDALRVIEVELNFIYQTFYTKAQAIYNWLGFFFRFVSVSSVLAALVIFVYDKKVGCHKFDVKVTYTLLYGAVALDGVSLLMLIFSDHSIVLLHSFGSQKDESESDGSTGKLKRGFLKLKKFMDHFQNSFLKLKSPLWTEEEKITRPAWFKERKYKKLCRRICLRRWSESISAFNLISYCLHERNDWVDKVIDYIGAKEVVDQWIYEKKQPLLQRLWIFIFKELERKSGDADDIETIQRVCSSRGEWVIQEGELERKDLTTLMPYVERNSVTFDQCLILWHIATDLLFYEAEDERQKKAKAEDERQKKAKAEKRVDGMRENLEDAEQNKNGNGPDLEKGSVDGIVPSVDGMRENLEDVEQNKNGNDPDLEKGSVDGIVPKNDLQDVQGKKNGNDPVGMCGKFLALFCSKKLSDPDLKKGSDDGIVPKNDLQDVQGKKNGNDPVGKPDLKKGSDYCVEEEFNKDVELQDFSKLLSDYMLYLLIMQPTMMSAVRGIGKIRFQDTCAEAINFFSKRENSDEQRACEKLRDVIVEHEPSDVKGDRSKSLLFDGCKLASVIKQLKGSSCNKWKLIAQVWVELLSYAAANCIPITHVQQMSKGGEFLSLVWLLMTHLGLAKQFQIKEGHARAKLIVGEEDQIEDSQTQQN